MAALILLGRIGVSEGIRRFLTDGIFSGVAAVLAFMPQTAILFLLLALLEDSGYMARAAFVMDSTLRPFGLSGKAFIPMLIGFGCTVPAVLSTETLEAREKETAILSLPFIPCSARFPVFVMIISAFFEKYAAVAAFSIYLLGILIAILSALLHSRSKNGCPAPPLTIELPKYRMPRIRNLMREVGAKLKDFLVRAGTIVFLSCVVISILSSLSVDFTLAETGEDSILAAIGRLFAAPFSLIGFEDGRIISALAAGFFAKESIVSTIEILIPEGLSAVLSPAGAASPDTAERRGPGGAVAGFPGSVFPAPLPVPDPDAAVSPCQHRLHGAGHRLPAPAGGGPDAVGPDAGRLANFKTLTIPLMPRRTPGRFS